MNILTPYHTLNDSDPAAEIMEMVARKCPQFMRTHLRGGIVERKQAPVVPLTPGQVRELRQRYARGGRQGTLEALAADYGVHYQTVVKHTADIRAARQAVERSTVSGV